MPPVFNCRALPCVAGKRPHSDKWTDIFNIVTHIHSHPEKETKKRSGQYTILLLLDMLVFFSVIPVSPITTANNLLKWHFWVKQPKLFKTVLFSAFWIILNYWSTFQFCCISFQDSNYISTKHWKGNHKWIGLNFKNVYPSSYFKRSANLFWIHKCRPWFTRHFTSTTLSTLASVLL